MDEERNIVQTVLKANNTFKDFSPSLSAYTHRKLSLVPGSSQLDTISSSSGASQRCGGWGGGGEGVLIKKRGRGRGIVRGFMQMMVRERGSQGGWPFSKVGHVWQQGGSSGGGWYGI